MSPASPVATVRLPDRPSLVDSTGTGYLEFRRTLKPAYGRLWAELAASVIGIIALLVVSVALVGPLDLLPSVLLAIVVGCALGFLEYVLSLFGHAAGHGDLSADRRRNDLLANVLIFPLTGFPVAEYRRVHLSHHRLLGHDGDPEDGYRERLDARFFIRSLSGFHLIQAVRRHAGAPSPQQDKVSAGGCTFMRLAAAAVHLAAVAIPAALGCWWTSAAWIMAFTIVTPTLNALRLVLEHRPTRYDTMLDGDATTRCFRGRWFASVFGAAGFRSHLIHHWDPQVHCTRLRDVERFLNDTGAKPVLDSATSTYSTTFVRLAFD